METVESTDDYDNDSLEYDTETMESDIEPAGIDFELEEPASMN